MDPIDSRVTEPMALPLAHRWLMTCLAVAAICICAPRADADANPDVVGNYGPTGLVVEYQPDLSLLVTSVQAGSPADGKFSKGDVIVTIGGAAAPTDRWERHAWLAKPITSAEAGNGVIRFRVRKGGHGGAVNVELTIPAMGRYQMANPATCEKTQTIMRAHADFLRAKATTEGGLQALAEHNMTNGTILLALLATGDDRDLDVVRRVYHQRMQTFAGPDTGKHTWDNGWQGLAVCEYFLRTGDATVMPLINAICESARKYQVNGGWTHWATSVNPHYVGGGLLNAAGTNMLSTLLLAKQCGAKVDDTTLHDALRFYYRFVGHGSNPYGDHRPENGYESNNGKTEQLAIAMQAASRAENGELYAMARDKCALATLHAYPWMLSGHTGPIGLMYYGTAASYLAEKKPDLYATWWKQTLWFRELSRAYDGSFTLAHAGRYRHLDYGSSLMLDFAAPLHTLQITGAPKSPHAKPFRLPDQPWGRKADLAFLSLEGGPAHRPSSSAPHIELPAIAEAHTKTLRRLAAHPEHGYREQVAAAIRAQKTWPLIEGLLAAQDPWSRHTGCLAVKTFHPWKMGDSHRWIPQEAFSPLMFDRLLAIVRDETQPLWLVDQAMIALSVASPEQTMTVLDTLLPWLQHGEWWLWESAAMALSPALSLPDGLDVILPRLVDMTAHNKHTKGFTYIGWLLTQLAPKLPSESAAKIADAFKAVYLEIPPPPQADDTIDLTGISSWHLTLALKWALEVDPALTVEMAKLSTSRFDDMRKRELDRQIPMLIGSAFKLEEPARTEMSQILTTDYRPLIVDSNRELLESSSTSFASKAAVINQLLQIDQLAGIHNVWKSLGDNEQGQQEWYFQTWEPTDKPEDSVMERYRNVQLPDSLDGWFRPSYDPATHRWTAERSKFGGSAPASFRPTKAWRKSLKNAGEVVFFRKSFELQDMDFAALRIHVYSRQGYRLYLNGHPIITDNKRPKNWKARTTYLNEVMKKHLRTGTNVIAANTFLHYQPRKDGGLDVHIEALGKLPVID